MNRKNDFRSFSFGFAEAKFEREISPNLLRKGHYDLAGMEQKIINSHEYLLLGYKGTGKSMVGARLAVISEDSPALYSFGSPISVDQLPFPSFRGIVPEDFDASLRNQYAWSLLLYSFLIDRLQGDGAADRSSMEVLRVAKDALSEAGVVPSLPETLRKLKTNKVVSKLTIPKIFERVWEQAPQNQAHAITVWLNLMQTACREFKSSRKHFLFIDGLDDLRLVGESGGVLLLSGLLQAVDSINQNLRDTPVKVVLCCRTDLYTKLSTPRKGKIRSDFGLELDWYQNPRDYSSSHLGKLVNLRSRLAQHDLSDLFKTYFPAKIHNEPTFVFLLKNTRHTPRDLLQMLRIIQSFVEGSGPLSEDVILGGLREYSIRYFRDELDDALNVYFDEDSRVEVLELLGTLRSKFFSLRDLSDQIQSRSGFRSKLNAETVIKALFETGFVGNITSTGSGAPSKDDIYYRFKFRSPHASLRLDEKFILHAGLWKAFNLA